MIRKIGRELYGNEARQLYENIGSCLKTRYDEEAKKCISNKIVRLIRAGYDRWLKNDCDKQMDAEFWLTHDIKLQNFADKKEKESGKPYNIYGDDGEYNNEVEEFTDSLWETTQDEEEAIFKKVSDAANDSISDDVIAKKYNIIARAFHKNDYEKMCKEIYEKEIGGIATREAIKIFGRSREQFGKGEEMPSPGSSKGNGDIENLDPFSIN